MFQLTLYPEVKQQLSENYHWYESRRPGLGSEFLLSLEASIKFIESNPLACRKRYKNFRLCVIDRFPYGVFYLVSERQKIILIAAVYHLHINPRTIRRKLLRIKKKG